MTSWPPMMVGAIYACLAGDSYSSGKISEELHEAGLTADQMLTTAATMAAAMLVDACGGRVNARSLSARWFRKITKREARRTARMAA